MKKIIFALSSMILLFISNTQVMYANEKEYVPLSECSILADDYVSVEIISREDNKEAIINLTIDKTNIVYYEALSITIDGASIVFSQAGKDDCIIDVSDNVQAIEDWLKGTGDDTVQLVIDLSDLGAGEWTAQVNFKVSFQKADGLFDSNGVLLASQSELERDYNLDLTQNATTKTPGYTVNTNVSDYKTHSLGYIVNTYFPTANSFVLSDQSNTFGRFALSTKTLEYVILHNNISELSECMFAGSTALKEINIPDKITIIPKACFTNCNSLGKVAYPETITTLADYAFSFTTNLKYFDIPKSCKTLGGLLFWRSKSIESINIPEGVKEVPHGAFCYASSLKHITLPEGLISISGESTFYNTAIETIEFPSTLKNIGARTFGECYNLKYITIPKSIETIDKEVFTLCSNLETVTFELPEDMSSYKLSEFKYAMFKECYKLKDFEIPSTITKIGDECFYQCRSFEDMTLPAGITDIGSKAFIGCTNLKVDISQVTNLQTIGNLAFVRTNQEELHIPDTVSKLGYGIFIECKNLKNVTLPKNPSVTTVPYMMFYMCKKLDSIDIPEQIKRIESYAFAYCYTMDRNNQLDEFGNTKSYHVSIPDTLEYIDDCAFMYDCFVSVKIPNSIKEIGVGAFMDVGNIMFEDVLELPSGLTKISDFAFFDCENVWNVIIPDSVTSIGTCAFANVGSDEGLVQIVIPESVTYIGEKAFNGTNYLKDLQAQDSIVVINDILIDGTKYQGTSLTIPDNVRAISGGAFSNIIPDLVVSTNAGRNNYYFNGMTYSHEYNIYQERYDVTSLNIEEFNISENVEHIGANAFMNTKWLKNKQDSEPNALVIVNGILIDGTKAQGTIDIPTSIHTIGEQAFRKNNNLTGVNIPPNVKVIDKRAFYDVDTNNFKFVFSNGLEHIGEGAFFHMGSVQEVKLPTTLLSIGDYAFKGVRVNVVKCYSLNSITIGKHGMDTTTNTYWYFKAGSLGSMDEYQMSDPNSHLLYGGPKTDIDNLVKGMNRPWLDYNGVSFGYNNNFEKEEFPE